MNHVQIAWVERVDPINPDKIRISTTGSRGRDIRPDSVLAFFCRSYFTFAVFVERLQTTNADTGRLGRIHAHRHLPVRANLRRKEVRLRVIARSAAGSVAPLFRANG